MPTYEYQCEKCAKTFEFQQSMNDTPLTTCPKKQCRRKTWGKGKVKRLLGTGAGLIFKGSGFYTTDYRSESYKTAARSESRAAETGKTEVKAETKSESKTEAKSESKPASKPESKPVASEPKSSKKK